MNNINKKTIFVIDDEELITASLARRLIDTGYDVVVQRNGEDGLKVALKKHPDLILLNIIMPKMDDLTFLGKIRQDEWGKNVPVIVLTNMESGEKMEMSREYKVYDYLVKTNWSLADVLEKVNQILSK